MALFKINRGVNANLPTARHDGYAYFTTDDGKFYIDFADPGGVLQEDGTTVERKALNAERADYVGYSLKMYYDGTESTEGSYNGLIQRTYDITPEKINAVRRNGDTIPGPLTLMGETIFNNIVYLNDETYADSMTIGNAIITGALKVVGPINGSVVNAPTLNGNATSADKVNHKLKVQFNGDGQFEYDGHEEKTLNISPVDIGAVATTDNYAAGVSPNGPAVSANKLNTNAGDATHPVYFADGVPVQVSGTQDINVSTADKVNHKLKVSFDSTPLLDYDGSTMTGAYADANGNTLLDITPESINAVRRNGDTIAGPLTINGVFTVNNDAYIDSATIGDLLVNGGTRFVGAVNAGTITASSFVGDLTGTASAATKASRTTTTGSVVFYEDDIGTFGNAYELLWDNTNNVLIAPEVKSYITVGQRANSTLGNYATIEGNDNIGSGNYSHVEGYQNKATGLYSHAEGYISYATGIGAHSEGYNGTAAGDYSHREGFSSGTTGNYSHAEGFHTFAKGRSQHVFGEYNIENVSSTANTRATYVEIVGNGNSTARSNARTLDWSGNEWLAGSLTATSLIGPLNKKITFSLRGNEQWHFDNSVNQTLDIIPNDMGIFDTIEGSTVTGESIFNNVVYLNDETYADSMTIENALVTGALRVVGDINGSVVNATTFNGNATSANKVNYKLKLQANGNNKGEYDGHEEVTINYTASDVGALPADTAYAAGDANHNALLANALNLSEAVGSLQLPVYFKSDGTPEAVSTSSEINILARTANQLAHKLKVSFDSNPQVEFDGTTLSAQNGGDANGNTLLDITPEAINAVRRNGDTIPGPLTLNGVFTVNNDAYIDSATIGDLLVNGGTRFIGAVNAGTITASSFVGSLTGNATTADKINHKLKIQFNGDNQCEFDGTALAAANGGDANGNTIVNITPSAIGAIAKAGDTFTGTLIYNKTGTTAILSNKYSGTNYPIIKNYNNGNITINASSKSLFFGYENTTDIYFMGTKASMDSNGYLTAPKFIGALQGNADTADAINHSLKYRLRGSDVWAFDGSTQSATDYSDANGNTIFDLVPNDIGIFDTLLGSTVQGESVFNNVVYLNDETYADSMTIGNALITGSLRVIGSINGSTINATSFVGTLTGNATSADKVNHKLKIQFNGSDKCEFDGSILAAANGGDANGNTIINITPTDIHAVDDRGDEMTGNLTFSNANIGIHRVGRSMSYHDGRDGAIIAMTSLPSGKYCPILSTKTTNGSWEIGTYNHSSFNDDLMFVYVPDTAYNNNTNTGVVSKIQFLENGHIKSDGFDGNATSADKINHSLKYRLRGNDIWAFDGSACSYEPVSDANGNTIFDLVPNDIGIFDTILGSTVSGESIFNNVVYLNDETYADSMTIENALITGALRVVGDINGSTINATSFVGDLTGNATSADKINHKLKIQFNGSDKCEFDGTGIGTNNDEDTVVNVTPEDIAAAPAVNGIYYGTCETAKGTKAKEVILVNGTGFQLVAGAMLVVKFTNASAAATMTLKVGTDAASAAAATGHTLYQYGTTKMADGTGTTGWPAGAVVLFIYDGASWFRQFWYNSTYTLPTVTNIDCGTAAATAAKAITNGTWLAERDGNIQEVTMRYANTHAGALTFHSKPLYINGHPSSATNYTLPAGKYMVYYDGNNYFFNTKGRVSGQNYVHSIDVHTSNGYHKIASFSVSGACSDHSSIARSYIATYRVRTRFPLASALDTIFQVQVSVPDNTDTLGYFNLTYPYGIPTMGTSGIRDYSIQYGFSSDFKTAEVYLQCSGNGLFEVELVSLSLVTDGYGDDGSNVQTAYITETYQGLTYTFDFLLLNNISTTSTPLTYTNLGNNLLTANKTDYVNIATSNTTTSYRLAGFSHSSGETAAQAYESDNSKLYFKNNELYASLHANKLYGTSNVSYGSTLPSSPTTGQLFFQIDGATGGSSGSSGGSLSLAQKSSGTMYVLGYDGSDSTKAYYNTNVYVDCTNGVLRGAAWNDYAEYRRDNHFEKRLQKPGNCVKENGDGTLSLTTKRLERGCEIISDTFGMAIGQNAREGYDTPIAVSGRVLAYPYESIEEFKAHIGYPVCSGPNGTVSIMTDEEEEKYASRIIGTISEIPTYDKWGESQIDVDGRIWIRIK